MCFLVPQLLANRDIDHLTEHAIALEYQSSMHSATFLWGLRAGSQGRNNCSFRAEKPEDSDTKNSIYIYNSRGQNHVEILIALGFCPKTAKKKKKKSHLLGIELSTLRLFWNSSFIYTPLIVKHETYSGIFFSLFSLEGRGNKKLFIFILI